MGKFKAQVLLYQRPAMPCEVSYPGLPQPLRSAYEVQPAMGGYAGCGVVVSMRSVKLAAMLFQGFVRATVQGK